MVLVNVVAAEQPGDMLDCVGNWTCQLGRSRLRYRHPSSAVGRP
jgi:hypothetical protein